MCPLLLLLLGALGGLGVVLIEGRRVAPKGCPLFEVGKVGRTVGAVVGWVDK